jgi:response regulator RpfG family c-di-GMP phosphodiesterase
MVLNNNSTVRFLIVDDDTLVVELLKHKLTSIGYICSAAYNGKDALEFMNRNEFEIVLLDIRMPGESGLETLEKIKNHFPGTAVIMITAQRDIETAVMAMKLGAYDYLTKPIDLTFLELSIKRALERRGLVLENLKYHVELEDRVEKQTQQIRQSFLNSITSLAFALEARDNYTSGHSQRVTAIATAIATEMDLDKSSIEKIGLAGMVHDIGKIGIKESILNKPGALTNEEYENIKKHCELGERILRPVIGDTEILKIVRHHHERYDGKGYPDGLSGKDIPGGARILQVADSLDSIVDDLQKAEPLSQGASIVAVADAFDAITTNRPYRKASSTEEAISEMIKHKGKQFDPDVIDALLNIFNKNKLVLPYREIDTDNRLNNDIKLETRA